MVRERNQMKKHETLQGILFYIIIILALSTVINSIKETTVVSLDEDGTAYIEKSSYAGIYSKHYVARVRNGKWEIKKLYEKSWGTTKKADGKWEKIIFFDGPYAEDYDPL